MKRCAWATSPLMQAYHDQEWGVPVHDDDRLFEFLTLEGAQAGLSWDTILRKRDRYRELFAGFEIAKVARFSRARVERILKDPGIVRNRAKVESTVSNAKAALLVRRELGSLDVLIWSFTGGGTMRKARPKSSSEVPASTPESSAMSQALRERGFRFVGPTICYALMQAVGMVDDHVRGCGVARSSR